MNVAVSFSGGKDSILALHEAVEAGHRPVALLVMYRDEAGRSWVHGIDRELLSAIAGALDLPLICYDARSETYNADMESALLRAKALGAEACVFGDIDTPGHREWDEARCGAVGLTALLPLWQRDRAEAVRKTLNLGYRCLIKCVRNDILPENMLGRALTHDLVQEIQTTGADVCGENGEYHTVVTDGPLFHRPVRTRLNGTVHLGQITAADIVLDGE